MPTTKKQSKRQPLRRKYAIKDKVKEHKRKMRRVARLNPKGQRTLGKDPGVPNLHPFKERLMQQAKRMADTMKMQRSARAMREAAAEARRRGDGGDLGQLAADAAQRGQEFSRVHGGPAAGGGGGAGGATPAPHKHAGALSEAAANRKAFYRHMRTVVEKADVILEVLDARDPMACRALDMESFILGMGKGKRVVLVLNKIDLVPGPVVTRWVDYLKRFFPTIAFKASTQQQKGRLAAFSGSRVGRALREEGKAVTGAGAAGAEQLLQLIKNYGRADGNGEGDAVRRAVTVGVIGYPNVGKSSIINTLKRGKAVGVSPRPGFTKAVHEIALDSQVRLLDCPGIVFDDGAGLGGLDDGGAGLLLRNCVSLDSMGDPELAVEGILQRCSPERLMEIYSVPRFAGAEEFLNHVARARGKLGKGGKPDLVAAARSVLTDWQGGKVPFYTLPPTAGAAAGGGGDTGAEEAATMIGFGGGVSSSSSSSSAAAMDDGADGDSTGPFVALRSAAPPATGAVAELQAASMDGGSDEEDGGSAGAAGLMAPAAGRGVGGATVVIGARAGAAAAGSSRRGASGAGSSTPASTLVPERDELGMGLGGTTALDARGRRKAAKDARKKARRASKGAGAMAGAAAQAMEAGSGGGAAASSSSGKGYAYDFGDFFGGGPGGGSSGSAGMET